MKLSGNACCSDFLLIGPTADTMRSFNKTLSVSSHCVYLETTADGEVGNRTDRGGDSGWKLGVLMLWTRTLSLSLVSNERTPKSLGKSFFVFDTFYKLLVWYAALAKSLLSRPPSLHVAMPSSSIHNPALISLRKKKKGKKEEEEENDNLAERVGGAMPAADGNAPQ